MNDLISWLAGALAEEERAAERMEHATDSSEAYSCPATRDDPLGDLPYGEENCTCNLAARKARVLRQVQAHRAILDFRAEQADGAGYNQREGDYEHEAEYSLRLEALDRVVRDLASIYSDRDGYKEEWSA